MRRFRFPLESVLQWRLTQLELEEAKLQGLFEERRKIVEGLSSLDAGKSEAERAALRPGGVAAQELWALDCHRDWLAREKQRVREHLAASEQRIAAQRDRVVRAERDLRLLERLKQRRLAEWHAEASREEEALAAEAFLARWTPGRGS